MVEEINIPSIPSSPESITERISIRFTLDRVCSMAGSDEEELGAGTVTLSRRVLSDERRWVLLCGSVSSIYIYTIKMFWLGPGFWTQDASTGRSKTGSGSVQISISFPMSHALGRGYHTADERRPRAHRRSFVINLVAAFFGSMDRASTTSLSRGTG